MGVETQAQPITRTASWRTHCLQSKGRRWSATAPLDDALVQVALQQLGLSKPSAQESQAEDNQGLYISGIEGKAKDPKQSETQGKMSSAAEATPQPNTEPLEKVPSLDKKGSWRSKRVVGGRRVSSCIIEQPKEPVPQEENKDPQQAQAPPELAKKGSWRSKTVNGRRISSCVDPDAAQALMDKREAKARSDFFFNFLIIGAIMAGVVAYFWGPIKAAIGI